MYRNSIDMQRSLTKEIIRWIYKTKKIIKNWKRYLKQHKKILLNISRNDLKCAYVIYRNSKLKSAH